ncbi:general secretion pathway protein GspB [Rhodoferax sp. 4810]|uniref:General secretion pathway protein GspB n=1 Tax=Thiospirillum jenense TaxID=1653858 RepID=A0A839HDX1_9GAMM|nr:general secretion pathway protein GspB [Thiospirillum jenense]MBB1074708.1 general secretion pathway protein GspB [Rhodoferax jenense]MBB1125448.1 general secretion pathway protein GspB [Thiospirillum jenense]
MSYILEALKKSQHTRALGQVPHVTATYFDIDDVQPFYSRWQFWGMISALLLASAALAIAVYLLLRPLPLPPVPITPDPVPIAPAINPPTSINSPASINPPSPMVVVVPAPDAAEQRPPLTRGADELRQAVLRQTEAEIAAALAELDAAPPVKQRPRKSPPPPPHASTAPKSPARSALPPIPPQQIPADIRADIEAFKHEIRRNPPPSRTVVTAATHTDEARSPSRDIGVQSAPITAKKSPNTAARPELTLTMTVHVYHRDPRQRFIYLNHRKMRERDTTSEGVTLKEILPNGVVLNYQGREFFQAR